MGELRYKNLSSGTKRGHCSPRLCKNTIWLQKSMIFSVGMIDHHDESKIFVAP